MVGMISCVVLVLLGANRSDDEETSLKLFSGADPISSLFYDPTAPKVGGSHCGAANIGVAPDVTSPILRFLRIF